MKVVDEAFEKAWERMLSRPHFRFRNLNGLEQENLKVMMRDVFMVYASSAPVPQGGDELKQMLTEGFGKLESALSRVRSGGGVGVSGEEPVQVTPELISALFDTSRVRTNMDEVEPSRRDVQGVGADVDSLRKLGQS